MTTLSPPTHPRWGEVTEFLRSAHRQSWRSRDSRAVTEVIREAKAGAVAAGDEGAAKVAWCYETALSVQDHLFRAFAQMKQDAHYDAWCSLERGEVEYGFLLRHLAHVPTETHVPDVYAAICKYQGLFPYKIFMSPEIREKSKSCSVCGEKVSIRRPCGHRVGEIYRGEMCVRIVDEVEFLGSAMVESPVQKYSVPFLVDPKTKQSRDHYDYSVVRYAISHLEHPLEPWSVEDTRRLHPHSVFRNVGRNAKCPCGSGRTYKGCCLKKDGVLLPHKQFDFPGIAGARDPRSMVEEVTFSRDLMTRVRPSRR